MAARGRRLEAERERDLAIEEAAIAYHEINHLRNEVEQLRREKASWEAGQDAWSTRHEQILWHVGAMAESLWCAFQQHRGDQSPYSPSSMSVEDAKLLALESFAQLAPMSDAQLYEEMHELYAKIAHMEAQHTKMAETIRQLKRAQEEVVDTRRAWTHSRKGIRMERHDPVSDDALIEADNDQRADQTIEFAPVHPLPEPTTSIRTVDAISQEVSPSDASVVELLQAQLTMYINYSKRHSQCEHSRTFVDDRIDQ